MIPIYVLWLAVLGLGGGLLAGMDGQKHPKPPKGLLNVKARGFVFGTYKHKYFTKSEGTDGHILICGGAGSGKSSSLAIPSLRAWQSAVFAIDIKGELSAATASKPGQRKIFNPMLPGTYGFDPFYLLRGSVNPTQEAHEIAAALVPEPANTKDPFWVRGAQNLLAGFILHYYHEGYSFVATVTEILSQPIAYHVDTLFKSTSSEAARLHLSQFVGMEGKTLAGIFAELSNHIMLFATDGFFRKKP